MKHKRAKEPGPYCFESDEDGHFYVIPVARMRIWSNWLQSDDAKNGVSPEWAYRVGGSPSPIHFQDYYVDGTGPKP